MLKPNRLVGVVGRDIVIGAGRGGSRRDVRDTSTPPAIFKHVFDEYSFSIILNLRQRHGLAVPRAGDRSYVTGSIRGWSRSQLTYLMGGC